ncbi:hypothetical protein PIB30_054697 [Stylosanthes scabra]|uniref:Uncharacterized protein n=1 Tax=Stylosanthes scabra TaxID=79078 RepID=A0ABU6VM08_9FABA|nr:hypothetical protein [Stylosanthes scabra]
MRYEKILEEAAAQKAKEQNKGKARGVEEDYDDEETEDKGGEWVGKPPIRDGSTSKAAASLVMSSGKGNH